MRRLVALLAIAASGCLHSVGEDPDGSSVDSGPVDAGPHEGGVHDAGQPDSGTGDDGGVLFGTVRAGCAPADGPAWDFSCPTSTA